MRKKLTVFVVIVTIAIILTSCYEKHNNLRKEDKILIPSDLSVNDSQKFFIFDRTKVQDMSVHKYLIKEMNSSSVYSLGEKIYIVTENSSKNVMTCYWACKTEGQYKPIAVTSDGSYIILENEDKKEFVAKLEEMTVEKKELIPTDVFPMDDFEIGRYSLLELMEE